MATQVLPEGMLRPEECLGDVATFLRGTLPLAIIPGNAAKTLSHFGVDGAYFGSLFLHLAWSGWGDVETPGLMLLGHADDGGQMAGSVRKWVRENERSIVARTVSGIFLVDATGEVALSLEPDGVTLSNPMNGTQFRIVHARAMRSGLERYAVALHAKIAPGPQYGVKIWEPGKDPRWFTNERHAYDDALALAACYQRGARGRSDAFFTAELLGDEY